MAKNIADKRSREKRVVSEMIDLYARKHPEQKEMCQALKTYACLRVDKCPMMETKTFCSNCKIHCYQKEKREQIREVMRFSGPRMLFSHPILCISHLIESKKEKRKLNS